LAFSGLIVALILCVAIWPTKLYVKEQGITLSNVRIINDHDGFIWSMSFSPGNRLLACANTTWHENSQVPSCTIWEVATGKKIATVENSDYVRQAFSPEGNTFATMGEGSTIRLWDATTWKEKEPARDFEPSGGGPVFWLDNSTLALWHTNGVTLWDLVSHKPVREFPDTPNYVAFSPDGKFLVTFAGPRGSPQGPIELWEVATGKKIWSFYAHRIPSSLGYGGGLQSATFAPDSKTFATGGTSNSVLLWDPASKEQIGEFAVDRSSIMSIAFSPDGKLLAAGDEKGVELSGNVYVWDLASGLRLGVWKTQTGVRQLAFSPDGKTLAVASCGNKGFVELWSVDEMLGSKAK
jgi:WD40 repeat protein